MSRRSNTNDRDKKKLYKRQNSFCLELFTAKEIYTPDIILLGKNAIISSLFNFDIYKSGVNRSILFDYFR